MVHPPLMSTKCPGANTERNCARALGLNIRSGKRFSTVGSTHVCRATVRPITAAPGRDTSAALPRTANNPMRPELNGCAPAQISAGLSRRPHGVVGALRTRTLCGWRVGPAVYAPGSPQGSTRAWLPTPLREVVHLSTSRGAGTLCAPAAPAVDNPSPRFASKPLASGVCTI
jgi:hypothetical protein